MENNKQRYIFYLKENGKIVLTDKKSNLTKEYLKELSKSINSNDICRFETSDDILILKSSNIVGIQICKNPYINNNEEKSTIINKKEIDGFDLLNVEQDDNDVEEDIKDYLENEEINISKEMEKLEDLEEIVEPELDFNLNIDNIENYDELNLNITDNNFENDNLKNDNLLIEKKEEPEKKINKETNIKKKSNENSLKKSRKNEKTKIIEGIEIKKSDDVYDKDGNKIYDMDFPESDASDDVGDIF